MIISHLKIIPNLINWLFPRQKPNDLIGSNRRLTVKKEVNIPIGDVINIIRKSTKRDREFWRNNSWFLHQDNAFSQPAVSIRPFCAKNQMSVLPQPRYSADLAPCDSFYRTPDLKYWWHTSKLKILTDISNKAIQDCFANWKRRWEKCINRRHSTSNLQFRPHPEYWRCAAEGLTIDPMPPQCRRTRAALLSVTCRSGKHSLI